ncbi:hypothetical protein THTE_1754 [Thermogutta terrifontis]|uniref:Uncharacterized protein n=1 Tax=Thermogutta terrifontis TaxID=1331910 RepID=A0A286REG7_9BACT|nr:hypothetical protein THTE_1754 [Thermogutta terrifontis]
MEMRHHPRVGKRLTEEIPDALTLFNRAFKRRLTKPRGGQ